MHHGNEQDSAFYAHARPGASCSTKRPGWFPLEHAVRVEVAGAQPGSLDDPAIAAICTVLSRLVLLNCSKSVLPAPKSAYVQAPRKKYVRPIVVPHPSKQN